MADREARQGCRREDNIQASLSYHKEKASQLVLHGWMKDYKEKAKHTTFWHTTNQPPNPAFPSDISETSQRYLVTSHNCTPCTVTTLTITAFSTSQTETGTVSAMMQPPYPKAIREHILHLCPLYTKEHKALLTLVSRLHETMTLLGSEKGLLATTKFLKVSGALMSNRKPSFKPEMPTLPSEVDTSNIPAKDPPK